MIRNAFSTSTISLLVWIAASGFLFAQATLDATASTVQTAKPDPSKTQDLIEQLGSTKQSEREAAAEQLIQCSVDVIPILEEKAKSTSDAEVRSRCLVLRNLIYQRDVQTRQRRFLKLRENDDETIFLGWPYFSKIVGDGRLSRRLFCKLIDDYPNLTDFVPNDPKELTRIAEKISTDVLNAYRTNTETQTSDAVALMYLSVLLNGECGADVETAITRMIRTAPYTQDIQNDLYTASLRKLCGNWIVNSKNDYSMKLLVAMEHSIPEGRVLAKRLLELKSIEPESYELAIQAMIRFGEKSDIPVIERWTTDERLLGDPLEMQVPVTTPALSLEEQQGNPPDTTQNPRPLSPPGYEMKVFLVRYQDMAIAACLKISGDDVSKSFPRAGWHMNGASFPEILRYPSMSHSSAKRRLLVGNTSKNMA